MPAYDYKCKKCNEIVEIIHGISQDKLKEFDCPKCNSKQKCERLISKSINPPVFTGTGWTVKSSGFGARGYKGKHQDMVRPIETSVDAPADKKEADMQFQKHIDSGGLEGIKPTFDTSDRSDPRQPKTAVERVKG